MWAMLEVSIDDLEWEKGRWFVKGDPDKGTTIQEIAMAARGSIELPDGVEAGLDAETVYDPPNLIALATTTTTIAVTGAALGMAAEASFSLDLAGLVMAAYVDSANSVTVVLFNPTAGAIDLASGTLKAFAWNP